MLDQQFNEGEVFELKGVEFKILSVGSHQVEGQPAGYSYSFRPVADIEKDAEIAASAEQEDEATTNAEELA